MESVIYPKVSVITVVFNDAIHIRETIDSFFSQTWKNKEYIIIDGGSTDGTADIISEYANRLAYWCSEPDKGIYDAMNKGIEHATGEWINFLNCGDYYADRDALKKVLTSKLLTDTDIIFGDSIEIDTFSRQLITASADISRMEMIPTFRHGSALIRTDIQKRYQFDLSLKKKLGYSLDWEMLYRAYKDGLRFCKINATIQAYLKEGVSDHPYRTMWYNYLITSRDHFSLRKFIFFVKSCAAIARRNNPIFKWIISFMLEFIVNDVLHYIPFWTFRKIYFKMIGTNIGRGSFIMKKNYIMNARRLDIGNFSHINRDCIVDARGGIRIGDNVSISHRVSIMTGGHDARDAHFIGVFKPIIIEDYAWLGVGCTVLQGVTVGRGAVVSAGAVVTKDVPPFAIMAGVPARQIGERPQNQDYHCIGWLPFT